MKCSPPYYRKETRENSRDRLLSGNYPVIGDFYDSYSSKLEDAYKRWRRGDVRTFVTELLRKYKPEVVITHDVNGEYGHGAHKLCGKRVDLQLQPPFFKIGTDQNDDLLLVISYHIGTEVKINGLPAKEFVLREPCGREDQ